MKRFFVKLAVLLGMSILISSLTAGILWIYASYKGLSYETYLNYVFFSSFIYIVIGIIKLKDISFTGSADAETAIDHMLANSVSEYNKDNKSIVNGVGSIPKLINTSLLMFTIAVILLATSYYMIAQ